MLLDINELQPISKNTWHFLPDPKDRWLQSYKLGNAICVLQRQPNTISKDDLLAIAWSVSVFRPKKNKSKDFFASHDLILSIALDQEDLRAMAETSNCSVRELQDEYGTKGFFGPMSCKVYCQQQYEDLGKYEGSLDQDDVCQFLLDTVADTLDIVEDPVLLD